MYLISYLFLFKERAKLLLFFIIEKTICVKILFYTPNSVAILSAVLMPSRAEEVIPPAYPAPSPQG